MDRVQTFLERTADRLGRELGMLDLMVEAGGAARLRRGRAEASDAQALVVGTDPARLVDPQLELARISRDIDGLYLFSDFTAQPGMEALARRHRPDAVGLRLLFCPSRQALLDNLPPHLILSICRDMEVRYGDPSWLTAMLPELRAQVAAMGFAERTRLPGFLAQWYALQGLGNAALERDPEGRVMLACCRRRFARHLARLTLTEVLREHDALPDSPAWSDLLAAADRTPTRLAGLSDALRELSPLFEGPAAPEPDYSGRDRQRFLAALRLYESALGAYAAG